MSLFRLYPACHALPRHHLDSSFQRQEGTHLRTLSGLFSTDTETQKYQQCASLVTPWPQMRLDKLPNVSRRVTQEADD